MEALLWNLSPEGLCEIAHVCMTMHACTCVLLGSEPPCDTISNPS